MRYVGRQFTVEDLDLIRDIIAQGVNRTHLSRIFCEKVDWRKPDGALKEMSCRVALLRMHRDGRILLPSPQRPANNHLKKGHRTPSAEPSREVVRETGELRMEIADRRTGALWNEYIDRYHYLGFTPLPGAQFRYFVRSDDQTLALLSFSAAAWKCAPRDNAIGWDSEKRMRNLHLVVNNSRFLILPWVQSKNLASRILSAAARRIIPDWHDRYGYEPVLLETFVEKERFAGTCYKASNWTCVGDTKGRGKLDCTHEHKVPVKSVWLYPLCKDYKRWLKS
jgi:hypothetical protein